MLSKVAFWAKLSGENVLKEVSNIHLIYFSIFTVLSENKRKGADKAT